ncbi:MAG: RnfH family protein [Gammaproteobacteria bacterium]|nr:RnfH family protein [Gammaproteobacteria bacterium]
MSSEPGMIEVEVAFALPHEQRIIALQVAQGTSALEAVQQSGILGHFPIIDIDAAAIGIFSRVLDGKSMPLPGDYVLQPRDRVEIYRPLQLDPKQVRLLRAARTKKARQSQKSGR